MHKKFLIPCIIGILLLPFAMAALAFFFGGEYLRAFAENRATSLLELPVHIDHCDLTFQDGPVFVAQGVTLDNPAWFHADDAFARIARVALKPDLLESIRQRKLVFQQTSLDRPEVHLLRLANGKHNWELPTQHLPSLNQVTIREGNVLFKDATNGTDIKLSITQDGEAIHLRAIGQAVGRNISGMSTLHFAGRTVHLDLKGRMGLSDFQAMLDIDHASRVEVTGRLQFGNLAITDIGLLFPAMKPVPFLETPLSPEWLNDIDAHITLDANQVTGGMRQLQALHTRIDLEERTLKISDLVVSTQDGRLSGTLALYKPEKTSHINVTLQAERFDIGQIPFWDVTGKAPFSGRIQMEGAGLTFGEMLATSSGNFDVHMHDGTIQILKNIGIGGNTLLSLLGEPHHTEITCLSTDLPLKNGLWETNHFIMETEDERIIGIGRIDWRSKKINYLLTPKRINLSIGIDPAPLRITGDVDHPKAANDVALLARQGGGPLGLGKIFAPAARLPSIQRGIGGNAACEGKADLQ